jgi:hypothetical protein
MRHSCGGFATAYVLTGWLLPHRPFLVDMPPRIALRVAGFRAIVSGASVLAIATTGAAAGPVGFAAAALMSVATGWNLLWAGVAGLLLAGETPRIRAKKHGISPKSP